MVRSNYTYVKLSKMTKFAMANILDPHKRGEFKRMMYKAELEEKINKIKKSRDPGHSGGRKEVAETDAAE